jgi:hypothetical protein
MLKGQIIYLKCKPPPQLTAINHIMDREVTNHQRHQHQQSGDADIAMEQEIVHIVIAQVNQKLVCKISSEFSAQIPIVLQKIIVVNIVMELINAVIVMERDIVDKYQCDFKESYLFNF